MGLQTETSTNKVQTTGVATGSIDGYQVGQSATDYVGFFGVTPAVQPTSASQAAVTDGSGGAASATSGVQALTSSYNSAILGNAIASILVELNAIRSALVTIGVIKGS